MELSTLNLNVSCLTVIIIADFSHLALAHGKIFCESLLQLKELPLLSALKESVMNISLFHLVYYSEKLRGHRFRNFSGYLKVKKHCASTSVKKKKRRGSSWSQDINLTRVQVIKLPSLGI